MRQGIYCLAKYLKKRNLIPYSLWSFIYDRLHRSVDKERLW